MGEPCARSVLGERGLGIDTVASECALPATRGTDHRDRRIEIISDPFSLLLGRCAKQPHEQKERHHRRDEIRVGHFPGTAVMPVAGDDLLAFDDYRRVGLASHSFPSTHTRETD